MSINEKRKIKSNAYGKLKLVFPTKEYKSKVENYLNEFFENGEMELYGDGGLDEIKDFYKWLEIIENDLSKETLEDRCKATFFLVIRKSDNKIVGNMQIRHYLTDNLLLNGGHIGESVRPSERNKGYATEMIRLALKECKKLGINRVLMVCDENNIYSKKSIIKNGGILENKILEENGKYTERYWISLNKRYETDIKKNLNVIEVKTKNEIVNEKSFKVDVYLNNFIKILKPDLLANGLCIKDNNYKWLVFYDYNSRIKLTAIYNQNNEIVEWYFDIARTIGKENNIPYEDDLYLDVVLRPNGEIILLDEDELKDAYERKEMTKEEYDETYKIANELINRIKGNQVRVKHFTDKYLNKML